MMTEDAMQNIPKFGSDLCAKLCIGGLKRELADRNAAFLRRKYPTHTRDQVAQDLNCSSETVKRWLDGDAPSAQWLAALARCYGLPWVEHVWLDFTEDDLARQEYELQRRRASLEADSRTLADKIRRRNALRAQSKGARSPPY